MRICSFLPGATEVVAALGLADQLVGISHECDYPVAISRTPVLIRPALELQQASSSEINDHVRNAAGTGDSLYIVDESAFVQAAPDLVITQDLCHVCAITPDQVQRAMQALPRRPDLLALNPTCLADILRDIELIAAATLRVEAGNAFVRELGKRLDAVREKVSGAVRPRVICLEWLDPLWVGGHWVPEMVEWAGGHDVLGHAGDPSRVVNWSTVLAAQPEVLVLMPCGFSISRTWQELHRVTGLPGWDTLPAVIHNRVFVVDASAYFSRPGPRLVEGIEILSALCHPRIAGAIDSIRVRRVGPGDPSQP